MFIRGGGIDRSSHPTITMTTMRVAMMVVMVLAMGSIGGNMNIVEGGVPAASKADMADAAFVEMDEELVVHEEPDAGAEAGAKTADEKSGVETKESAAPQPSPLDEVRGRASMMFFCVNAGIFYAWGCYVYLLCVFSRMFW